MSQNTIRSATMFRGDGSYVWCLFFVYLLLLLDLTTRTAEAHGSPSSDFTTHRIAKPTFHHGRTRREIATTRVTNGSHHPEVTLTVSIDGEEYVLELRLNDALVPNGHVISYQEDGETKLHKPDREELDICQYSGHVRGRSGSWAAVSTCQGVRGVIYDGKHMRYIEPVHDVPDNDISVDHFIYSHEHLAKERKCGYEGGVTTNSSYDPLLFQQRNEELARRRSRISRYKRDTHEDIQVREPYNANKLSRYVELVLVVDNGEFRASGEDVRGVHRQMKDVANIINSVYAPLNIFIALVGVVVWSERDLIELRENGDDTLNNFLHYRMTRLAREIPNDNAQLLTHTNFLNGVVGKALKGYICSYNYSAGVATNHSRVIGLVAMTIAHEMGHNFGMEHDTEEECTCPDKKCIMSPSSTSVTPTHWSSCSLKSLALSFERGMDYCLRNKPAELFEAPTCGNGFLEPGEQCDCGTPPGEHAPRDGGGACHACCRADCTLRDNATCGHGQCCDLKTCRPKAAGTECRTASRECDLPEYCSGHSQFCPRDVHKMDATPCGNGQAFCMQGSCRGHADQCRLLWGSTGETSDQKCYRNANIKGDDHGNCGYDRVRQIYHKCAAQDALCGMLQCRHLNERLEFGMESAALLSATFINNNGTIIPCRTAIIDLGLNDVDPGLVPDGAKCGDNKMCRKQRCVPVELVTQDIAGKPGSVCPSNCSGHGVCNSEGHCHCEPGFAPPLCALPGAGGSQDSGPASDPSVQRNFMVAMYIIFLGIIPSILLILFIVYYSRHNVLHWWKKPHKSYVHKLLRKHTHTSTHNSDSPITSNIFNKIPVFNKFKNIKHDNDGETLTVKNSNIVVNDTPQYANIASVINPVNPANGKTCNVNSKNVKEPVKLNRKINKEDIVIADSNRLYPVLDSVPVETNVLETKEQPVAIKPKLRTAPKPAISSPTPIENAKPSVSPKPAIKRPDPNVNISKPGVLPKPSMPSENKPKPEVASTGSNVSMNEIMSQRNKLRKVTNGNAKK